MKNAELWKRILNQGVCNVAEDFTGQERELIQKSIVTSPIIINSVAIPEDDVEGTPFSWKSYTGIGIPFDRFWVESKTDRGMLSGCQVESRKTESGFELFMLCACAGRDSPPTIIGFATIRLDAIGNCVPEGPRQGIRGGPVKSIARATQRYPELENAIGLHAATAMDALQILGCKNVSLEPRDNDPKQVRRAVKRHGGTPDKYRYHVLVVRPAGSKPGTPGQEIGIMPRHVCRGHFSEYGPEFGKGLLFGKYAGRFFIPPHMKGDKKNGVVEKDYSLVSAK